MAEPDSSDDDVTSKLVDAQEQLKALESGNLHIGAPFEGRTEAKVFGLKQQIAMYEAILARRNAHRT